MTNRGDGIHWVAVDEAVNSPRVEFREMREMSAADRAVYDRFLSGDWINPVKAAMEGMAKACEGIGAAFLKLHRPPHPTPPRKPLPDPLARALEAKARRTTGPPVNPYRRPPRKHR